MPVGNNGGKRECNGESSSPTVCTKRKDYLNWDEYFMAVAFLSAQRSKDPHSTGIMIKISIKHDG